MSDLSQTQPIAVETPQSTVTDPAAAEISRMTRRSLLWAGVAAASVFGLRQWLVTRPEEDGIPWPLRRVLDWNERLARDYFSATRLAPEFPRSAAGMPRANGEEGLSGNFAPEAWKLSLEGLWNEGDETGAELTLGQVMALPRVEMVTELKCIEGWSQVVHWGGARLADLIARHPPMTRSGEAPDVDHRPADLPEYVSLETPDGGYYVGLEMASALHPQTLLAYEMNGEPLRLEHGAPLRLVVPVKYGIKNIKRIGTIRFTNTRPADYWAERGYDWYAGH